MPLTAHKKCAFFPPFTFLPIDWLFSLAGREPPRNVTTAGGNGGPPEIKAQYPNRNHVHWCEKSREPNSAISGELLALHLSEQSWALSIDR
ncbi:hypothetical protein RRG08_043427 [Elysia crispata]|uniref:Uncharacterized protein n=1 Tax=Elysia crispata TaxID=231223 RepID=A0AAE1D0N2_9GAST|nr:hypothetical protein RRG08_043427 [Elysia crispata]